VIKHTDLNIIQSLPTVGDMNQSLLALANKVVKGALVHVFIKVSTWVSFYWSV
jgi:hypothetical protein